jgi:hypothetical protein
MPKCQKCGKKFNSLQALNDHFRSVHPNERFVAPKQASSGRTLLAIVIIVIVVMGSAIGYLIYVQVNTKTPTTNICTTCIGQPVSSALFQNLTGVSSYTLNQIGAGQGVTKLTAISGSNLTSNGKPEVLYIGAEYCPFCAAERWALIVALSKFGTFSNLSLMLSADSPEAYPDTATFSFVNSSYTSQYVSFVSVEYLDRGHNPLQTITQSEQAIQSQYDSGGSIPFVDIANKYTNGNTGSQFEPYVLRVGGTSSSSNAAPLNWTQIGSQLNSTSGVVPEAVDGTANDIISAICSVDGGQPANVCSQGYASLTLAVFPQLHNSLGAPIMSIIREEKLTDPFRS